MGSAREKQRRQGMPGMHALCQDVEEHGAIAVLPMWRLWDTAGWKERGVNVTASDIANLLDQHGMGTLPRDVGPPPSQGISVRVYSKGSRVGEPVEAVTRPSRRGDHVLREAGANDAGDVFDRIRSLVAVESCR